MKIASCPDDTIHCKFCGVEIFLAESMSGEIIPLESECGPFRFIWRGRKENKYTPIRAWSDHRHTCPRGADWPQKFTADDLKALRRRRLRHRLQESSERRAIKGE